MAKKQATKATTKKPAATKTTAKKTAAKTTTAKITDAHSVLQRKPYLCVSYEQSISNTIHTWPRNPVYPREHATSVP